MFLASPLIFLYVLGRLLREPAYRTHFAERLGSLPRLFKTAKTGSIWIHAVSVGEVASALPLLKDLRKRASGTPLFLSTSTVGGRRIADQQAAPFVDGIFYAPFDFVWCVRRVLKRIRPALLVVLETEIWPNLFAQTHLCGARILLVNARISDRAWPKYRRARVLFAPILELPELVFAQSDLDVKRFRKLGAPADQVRTEANLKYDAAAAPTPVEAPTFGAEQIWIAASTVGPNEKGSLKRHDIIEEQTVIEVFRAVAGKFPKLLLILAPRQPGRFEETANRLAASGVSFVRRSEMRSGQAPHLLLPGVLLLDTLGELAGFYARADVVFVGGSLAPRGGHNILEPAFAGAPIVVGPHMHNFHSISEDFVRHSALITVHSPAELRSAVESLLSDPVRAREIGDRGRRLVQSQRGAAKRIAQEILEAHSVSVFRKPRVLPLRTLLGSLACLWEFGGCWKRRHGEHLAAQRSRLGIPVVSIGGITVGGSGKTPFANYLLRGLRERGYSPALLTRGYRRRSPAKFLVAAPGARLPTSFTGDEAQVFLRSGIAPVGIGADRYQAGRLLLREFPETNIAVLDDGFQHSRVHRDADIVLIDGLDPFGGSQVVPLGRLREPLSALKRAHIFVITRCTSPVQFRAIKTRLARYNANASAFEARLQVRGWRDVHTNAAVDVREGSKVFAFCGLGNPKAFWQTLEALRLEAVSCIAFPDHHPYKPAELRRLRHDAHRLGATVLVTTQKDRANLPVDSTAALDGMPTAWLEIDLSIEDEEAFFTALSAQLG